MWFLVDHWSYQAPTFDEYGDDSTWSTTIVGALEPVLSRHGIPSAAPGQRGCAVVWCSPAQQIQVRNQDIEDPIGGCTDLWVEVNPAEMTISIHFEGFDLLQHVRGAGSLFDHPEPLALANKLEDALSVVAGHLQILCDAVVVTRNA